MYSPTSQYLKTRFRWEAMGLSGRCWETWCPLPSSCSFPRQKRRLSPFLATKSVALGQRYTSLISYHYRSFFLRHRFNMYDSYTSNVAELKSSAGGILVDIQIDAQWTNYLKFDSDDDILLVWLSTTVTACLCIYYWKSPAMIHSLVEKEVSKGIPSSRIVLGGFSQVGAVFSLVNVLKFFSLKIMIEFCHQIFNKQHLLISSSAPFF